jgi:hypothetical protein
MQARTVLIVSQDLSVDDRSVASSSDLDKTAVHDAISLMIYRLLEFSPSFPIIHLGISLLSNRHILSVYSVTVYL